MSLRRVVLLVGIWLALASPARAEDVVAGQRAVELGKEALELFSRGAWLPALERFRAADRLYHSPVFVLYAARCSAKVGRLLDARRDYQRLAAETLPEAAPEPWTAAQRSGRDELRALEPEIPRVVVVLEGGSARAVLEVDGEPRPLPRAVELDPGRHRFVARDGARETATFLVLPRAARQRLVLRLPPRERPAPAPEPAPAWPSYALVGAGGAALVAGGVFGALALGKASSVTSGLPDSCRERTCPTSRRNEIEAEADRARTLATVSNVLLVSGVALAATGTVLWLSRPAPRR